MIRTALIHSVLLGVALLSGPIDDNQQAAPSPCSLDGSSRIAPERPEAGQSITVQHSLTGRCPKNDVVITHCWIGSFRLGVIEEMRHQIVTWVGETDLASKRVGIIGNPRAETLQTLTDDREALLSAARSLDIRNPSPSTSQCVLAGLAEFNRTRSAGGPVGEQSLVYVGNVMVDEAQTVGAVNEVKTSGVTVFVSAIDLPQNRRLASSPAKFFGWPRVPPGQEPIGIERAGASVRSALRAVDDAMVHTVLSSLTVTSTVPAEVTYIQGSANHGGIWSAAERLITWKLPVPAAEISSTLSYRVTAATCGDFEVGKGMAHAVDSRGNHYSHDYSPQSLHVPCVTPTATASITPSPTITSEPTPTTVRTLTPTPRPTSEPQPIFLPVALKEEDCTQVRRVAVALVIDTSSSMQEPTGAGVTKLQAAQEAASAFVDLLSFPSDQAAIIGFHASPRIAQPLTSDARELHAGLASLVPGSGTNIAAGLAAAHAELTGPRRNPPNFPALVLLTDGRASVAPDAVVPVAEQAKADGVVIFTVGLGEGIDRDQLRSVASRPEWYFESADGDDLADVYGTIAVTLPCPVDRYWGRRMGSRVPQE